MHSLYPKKETGFTLIEMLMVILIIAATTKIIAVSFEDIGFSARYEQTISRLDTLRQAIVGNPKRTINGQPDISGFVADMGRLPDNVRELVQSFVCINTASNTVLSDTPNQCIDANELPIYLNTPCSDNLQTNQVACEALSAPNNTWVGKQVDTLSNSGLSFGWNGPYLQVSDNPNNTDTFTDGWGNESVNDYGWLTCLWDDDDDIADGGLANNLPNNTTATANGEPLCSNTQIFPNLTLYSLGKNGTGDIDSDGETGCDGTNYDGDCYTTILEEDYSVDITSGISVSFIKPLSSSIPVDSFCSDPSKITKTACEATNTDTSQPYGEWYGGCSASGYINKDTCIAVGQKWYSCHINTLDDADSSFAACTTPNCYKTRTACLNANGVWFGEGYGCDNADKSDKATCEVSDLWRSCTDGISTTKSACDLADEIWYGENIINKQLSSVSVKKYQEQKICMKLFYRDSNSNIVVLTADLTTITEDGSYQTIRFLNFKDISNTSVGQISMGINAIGIYEHDGTNCTNTLYPNDRTQPIPVQFIPHTNLPIINW